MTELNLIHNSGFESETINSSTSLNVRLKPLRFMGVGMLSLGLLLPRLPHDPGLPCPLRTLTGIPCPFCGMTTSVEGILSGNFMVALNANPFGYLAVAIALIILVSFKVKILTISRRLTILMGGLYLTFAWIFELFRFHII